MIKSSSSIRYSIYFRDILVSTQELVNTIRQIQKASNQNIDPQLWEIINQFDHNKDGFIEADEILEVKFLFFFFSEILFVFLRHWN